MTLNNCLCQKTILKIFTLRSVFADCGPYIYLNSLSHALVLSRVPLQTGTCLRMASEGVEGKRPNNLSVQDDHPRVTLSLSVPPDAAQDDVIDEEVERQERLELLEKQYAVECKVKEGAENLLRTSLDSKSLKGANAVSWCIWYVFLYWSALSLLFPHSY